LIHCFDKKVDQHDKAIFSVKVSGEFRRENHAGPTENIEQWTEVSEVVDALEVVDIHELGCRFKNIIIVLNK
jgi:hypothetical protein